MYFHIRFNWRLFTEFWVLPLTLKILWLDSLDSSFDFHLSESFFQAKWWACLVFTWCFSSKILKNIHQTPRSGYFMFERFFIFISANINHSVMKVKFGTQKLPLKRLKNPFWIRKRDFDFFKLKQCYCFCLFVCLFVFLVFVFFTITIQNLK